jgi:hypothetical protein
MEDADSLFSKLSPNRPLATHVSTEACLTQPSVIRDAQGVDSPIKQPAAWPANQMLERWKLLIEVSGTNLHGVGVGFPREAKLAFPLLGCYWS